MGHHPSRLQQERGFTLIELIIGMAIVGLLMGAIGNALVIGFTTTNTTSQRFKESHDEQISSAYLANDVQSAAGVSNVAAGGSPCLSKTKLVDFNYASGKTASYFCLPATEAGQPATNVTRSFTGQSDAVVAHFAAATVPTITCQPSCSSKPDTVSIAFKESDGYRFSLLGSRRAYPSSGGSIPPPPPPLTLLATGSSPLWILGGCKPNGAQATCIIDPNAANHAVPIGDVANSGWTVTPLWNKLSDGDDATQVVNNLGVSSQAKVALSSVLPPSAGVRPTFDIRARVSAGNGTHKLTMYLYQGTTLIASQQVGPIDQTTITDYLWTLTQGETNSITNYTNLTLGFAMTAGGATDNVNVYDVAMDTASLSDTSGIGNPSLKVNGYLYINSTDPKYAVKLTGTKNSTKITIADTGSGSGFKILSGGGCTGCSSQTVACGVCVGGWQPGSFGPPKLPDPLRFMSAPTDAGVASSSSCPPGYTTYQPGTYNTQLHIAGNACLNGGIYILGAGMKVDGTAHVVGQNVLLYNKAGAITFTGGSDIQLTAYNSAPYRGILIFQARCPGDDPLSGCGYFNDSPLALSGGSTVGGGNPALLLGVLYAPASTGVTLGTGGANLKVTAVIAQNITVTGNSLVTIG